MASASQQSQEQDLVDDSQKVKVTILASEWGSSNGGIGLLSKELAVQLAKLPEVEITIFLLRCSEGDKKEAVSNNVEIVKATRYPGFDELDWLNFPPEHLKMDVVVGYGLELGRQAQNIKKSKNCKWVQVVHNDPEETEVFKSYSNQTAEDVGSHNIEAELCEMADLVVGVGPKLCAALRSYLRSCQKDHNVVEFTPGVFREFATVKQSPHERKHCKVLVFGCGDKRDFSLKGFDIAGKAVALTPETRLVFAGAPDGMRDQIVEKLKGCGVPAKFLSIRGCVQNRGDLKRLFQEVDLLLMPSIVEGFGLTGLEALSAGLPLLVSKKSGLGEALSELPFGSLSVVDSEDPKVWATAIGKKWKKDRPGRFEEAKTLRTHYDENHSWVEQSRNLLDKMISVAYGMSFKLHIEIVVIPVGWGTSLHLVVQFIVYNKQRKFCLVQLQVFNSLILKAFS